MSIVPGLGHWFLGKRRKAAAFLIIALGLLISLFLVKSPIGLILICLAYVAITRAEKRLLWIVRNRLGRPTYPLTVADLKQPAAPLKLEREEGFS